MLTSMQTCVKLLTITLVAGLSPSLVEAQTYSFSTPVHSYWSA